MAVNFLNNLLKEFGLRRLDNLKLYWKELERLSQSSFANVRQVIMEFYFEAVTWVGEPMK